MLVIDVIKQSLGLLGYLPYDEPVQAEDAELGLRVLNMVGGQMALNGEWPGFEYINTTSVTLPIQLHLLKLVVYRLALDLAPYYSIQPTPALLASLRDIVSDVRANMIVDVSGAKEIHPGEGNNIGYFR